ncbi:unnamed protein product [Meganyctiphanes norvegica]|uniref:Uncharacterized protein n=1 Tax=Meganyctiphanes norvegica TaxID=48144 RepID=A0AAV2PQ53_MEGNR
MSPRNVVMLCSCTHIRVLLIVGCVVLSTTIFLLDVASIVRDSNEFTRTLVDQHGSKHMTVGSKKKVPWWDGGTECASTNVSSLGKFQHSTGSIAEAEASCGERASAMGTDQKVVSFTLYGDDPQYAQGLEDNIVTIAQLYPGYLVRLYTDPRGNKDLLCPLLQQYPTLFVCDVTSLPGIHDQLMNIHPQMWRFAPMGDPQVQILLVRDIDSLVSPREVAAVREWLLSDTVLHTMRDHPQHHEPIMAGMWGVRTKKKVTAKHLADIKNEMFANARGDFSHGLDQKLLKKVVWAQLHTNTYGHDSFKCHTFWHSHPWPTKRPDDRAFVGSPVFRAEWKNNLAIEMECPDYCRPKKHKDWIYC